MSGSDALPVTGHESPMRPLRDPLGWDVRIAGSWRQPVAVDPAVRPAVPVPVSGNPACVRPRARRSRGEIGRRRRRGCIDHHGPSRSVADGCREGCANLQASGTAMPAAGRRRRVDDGRRRCRCVDDRRRCRCVNDRWGGRCVNYGRRCRGGDDGSDCHPGRRDAQRKTKVAACSGVAGRRRDGQQGRCRRDGERCLQGSLLSGETPIDSGVDKTDNARSVAALTLARAGG